MRESPQTATTIGDYRYNDKWDDASLAHVPKQRKDLRKWLARFESVDTAGFPEQEKLSHAMMVRSLKERVEAIDLKLYLMPVDQFSGIHLTLAQFVIYIPFNTTKQYDDYLARLHKVPQVIDQVIGVLREGEKEKLLPPAYLLDKTVTQCSAIAEPAGVANAFGQPVSHFPDAVTPADQKRLHDAILAAVDNEVRPAYRKLQNFLSTEYAPKGRKDEGIWSLPNGDQLYRFNIRQSHHNQHRSGSDSSARAKGSRQNPGRTACNCKAAWICGFENLPSFAEDQPETRSGFARADFGDLQGLYRANGTAAAEILRPLAKD